MKKRHLPVYSFVKKDKQHAFRTLRGACIAFSLVGTLQSTPTQASSLSERVTQKTSNLTLAELIKEVEKNSSYLFVFNEDEIDTTQEVTVAENQSVKDCLDGVSDALNISYVIEKEYIVLKNTQAVNQKSTEKQVTIKGTVVDPTGEPIIGANVIVRGTKTGSITDLDGNFTIEAPKGAVIETTYIGCLPNVLTVGDKTTLKIVLKEDTQKLDEVVVVGYGTTTKRSIISSVATVKSAELVDLPVANITQGLAGRAPGLIVQGNGGGINKQSKISIRGGDTPLVVIDGVIRDYSDFVALAPEDIETFSILKDASATAVYGSRAANGILQVATKKGKEGNAKIDYNFNASWAQPSIWPEQLDSYTRAEYANIARINDGLEASFSEEAIQAMRDGSNPLNYGNTNWRELVLRNFAPQTKHSLRMTGGTKANNYYVSLGHLDQESLYKANTHNMQRTNFRLSQSSEIESIGLKTTATLDGYVQKTTHPYSSTASGYYQVFSHIQDKSPLGPGLNQYGLPYNVTDNPVAETSGEAGYNKSNDKLINGNLSAVWNLPWVKGLSVRANGNYRYYVSTYKQWRKDAPLYNWDSTDPIVSAKPLLYHKTNTGYTYNGQFFVEYAKTLGSHSFNVLGGYEGTYSFSDSYWEQRENYDFPIDQIGVGSAGTQTNGGGESERGRAGWIGQAKYNYANKYFVEGSLRYDGSDNFAPNRRWGTFYSGSVGWSIIDENFMEVVRDNNILNTLKARASYGQVGLDNWSDPYSIGRFAYLSSYAYTGKAWVVNGAYVPGFSEGAIPSPDLSWFTTDQFDAGVDFASLNNRLYGSLDYFYYRTKGFLYSPNALDVGYTGPLGMSLPKVSTDGEFRRAGFEFQLGWRDEINGFTYDVSANFTKFDQLWANLPSESESSLMNPWTRQTGQTGYYGNLYKNLGFYTSAEDVYNSVKRLGSTDLTAGDIKYYDFNGDGKLDGSDQIRLGKSSFPRANYGISINLGYKGFFVNALFQGATRFDMYASGTLVMNSGQTGQLPIIYDAQTDFWHPDNTDARFPRLSSNAGFNGNNNYVSSDFWLINGAYLRMKDIKVGYDFKQILLKKAKWLTTANVAFTGQNIFTISEATKYGLDPENSSVENYGYPNERVYAISINLGF